MTRQQSGRKPNPKRDEMRAMYLGGARRVDIERALGVSASAVAYHTRDLPRVRPYSSRTYRSRKNLALPAGQFGLLTNLEQRQLVVLDNLAIKWGCETLSEAALEILRDALEEVE